MSASSTTGPRLQLAAVQVRRLSEATSLLVTSTGQELLVRAPAAGLLSLLQRCDGTASFHELAAGSAQPAVTLRLLDALVATGCVETADVEIRSCSAPPR